MLELKNITKKFGDIMAVNNLSFSVKMGEIVGLIGENGSGKTTTIKMIAGLYEPSFGQILIANIDVTRKPEQTKTMIGYIPDEPAVYNKLTGDEFLHFITEAFSVNAEMAKKKISELKKLFPMEGQTNGFFEDYSRGTRQKFMIMGALLHEPPLLLIDEPIVGLDPKSVATTTDIITDYVKDKKHAILLCTHTLSFAEKVCSRFIVLHSGTILAEGTLSELRQKADLENGSLQNVYLKLSESTK